jgi:hypothetical protein
MRLNALPGLRATVAALPGHQPPRIRLTAGPFTFTVDPDEAIALADRLVDAVEAIRQHPTGRPPNDRQA